MLFLGLGGFLFYQAFKNTEFTKLVDDFAHARYEYAILSMIMGYIAFISRGIRWIYLLEPLGEKPKLWNSIHAVTIGYFTNLLIPRAGELARCTALNRTDKIPVNRLFGTVVLERIIDLFMMALLVGLTFILEYDNLMDFFQNSSGEASEETSNSGLALKLALGGVVVGAFIVAYYFRDKFRHFPLYSKVKDFWAGFKEGLKSLSKIKRKWEFAAHTLFIWILYYLMFYVNIFAMDATRNIDTSNGLFMMMSASFGMIIPAPGGIGSVHYLVMLAGQVIGLSADDGVSFGTLVHSAQTLMTIISGLIAFAFIYRARRKLKKNAATTSPTSENS